MAQRSDIDRGREIVERWCALAERRLDYLTDLFETGRWRRFHTEEAFLENIREAKAAVQTWRMLASREATPNNRPVDFAWLGRDAVPLAQRNSVRFDQGERRATAADVSEPIVISAPAEVAAELPVPEADTDWGQGLDLATIQQRYPLLRNTLS